ncbi:MAG: hypothetical protein K6U02_02750 [Firmicutes bacterium]|nr:hypothetical protein [Bacillota bacterium]
MTDWKPGALLRVLLVWTGVVMTLVWLPLLRGPMDGPSYQWGWPPGLRGSGVGGDYWVVVLTAAVGLSVLWLGWRGARRPVHFLLPLWHLPPAAAVARVWWRDSQMLRFRGDTLGIDISLSWMAAALLAGMFLLAVLWAVRDWPHSAGRAAPPWGRANRGLLLLAGALLPVQFVLLRFGKPHGTTDQLGVILILLQWLLLNLSFAVRRSTPSVTRGVS